MSFEKGSPIIDLLQKNGNRLILAMELEKTFATKTSEEGGAFNP